MIFKNRTHLKSVERFNQNRKDNNWKNGHKSVNSAGRKIDFYKAIKENHHIGEYQ